MEKLTGHNTWPNDQSFEPNPVVVAAVDDVLAAIRVDRVTFYRARMHGQVTHRRTWPGLCQRIAWWLVAERYARTLENWNLESIKVVGKRECTCDMCDVGDPFPGEFWDHRDCPIHDRDNGYFRRLQQRIARWLEAGYIRVDGRESL